MKKIPDSATSGRPTEKKVVKPDLMKAIEIVGGVGKLADLIMLDQTNISKWLYTERKIPAHHVRQIVKATKGKVMDWQLRPDVFEKKSP